MKKRRKTKKQKTVNFKLAMLIIAAVSTLLLIFIVKTGRDIDQEVRSVAHKNIYQIATVGEDQSQPEGWKLISGNPGDICSIPVYVGNVTVHGWYAYDTGYEGKKKWLLRIAKSDIEKLPLYQNNRGNKDFHLEVSLSDASPALEKQLKGASAQNPIEIKLSRYMAYCSGTSLASVQAAKSL